MYSLRVFAAPGGPHIQVGVRTSCRGHTFSYGDGLRSDAQLSMSKMPAVSSAQRHAHRSVAPTFDGASGMASSGSEIGWSAC